MSAVTLSRDEELARATGALNFLDPDDRDLWVKMAFALKSEFGEDAYDAWELWGSLHPRPASEIRSTWKSASAAGSVGIGSLFWEAKRSGWRDDAQYSKPSPEQIAAREKRQAARLAAEAAAEAEEHARAAAWAQRLWNAATPAITHPYLTAKGVGAHGLRVGKWERFDEETGEFVVVAHDALLVPIYDRQRNVRSLQCILAKLGAPKYMLRGGAKSGNFHPIGSPKTDHQGRRVFVLAEGYATGASVHEATGHMVLVCFDRGNLLTVAQQVRERQAEAVILIAADNDQDKADNPGLTAARKAAAAVLGVVAHPVLPDAPAQACDFNDLHQLDGVDAVADCISKALVAFAAPSTSTAKPAPPTSVAAAGAGVLAGGMELLEQLPFCDVRDGTVDTRPLTELGNALRLLDGYGDRLRHVPERKAWLVWDDGRWRLADAGVVRSLAAGLSNRIYTEGAGHLLEADHFAKWARSSQQRRVIESTVALLGDMPMVRIDARQLDADAMLCGLNGGREVLDLCTGQVRAATQADLVTRSLGVAELGDASKAVRWKAFMAEVFQEDVELIDWVHRFLGYSLTGSVVEQLFVFAFGGGANGKSVLTESIARLMGDYACSMQPATLCDDRRSASGASADLAQLDGVRFAVAPEAEENSRFNEPLLKGLVSGDRMQVRELYCPPREMCPTLKLAMTGNHKPSITGTDRGIWRRVRLVPFLASFEGRADASLQAKLQAEFPHILAWCVEGCMEWQRRGLQDTPRAVADATEAYRQESDTLGHWLSERCTRGPNADEPSTALYADFREWCLASGFSRPWSAPVFGKKLTEYRAGGWNIGERRTSVARYRTGIALKSSTPI